MQTDLDEYTLGRVVEIVNDACGAISGASGQEHMFMLACLQLAYNLEKISGILEPVDRRLDAMNFKKNLK